MRFFKPLIASLALILSISQISFAQDSIGAIKNWTVESKKIADGKYELIFSGVFLFYLENFHSAVISVGCRPMHSIYLNFFNIWMS
mgnify:CR=1 FL=1